MATPPEPAAPGHPLGCLDIVDVPVDAGLAYQLLMSAHLSDLAV